MQNKTLAITRQCIPYYKELRQVAGSVTASILMQQLDYWFSKQDGEPFYKFKAPCENDYYKSGDSFTEELGFSIEEFTNAFAKIGFSYKSKTEFENTVDKFQGMFYCSYFDRKEGLTFYFRNHKLLDIKLNELFTVKRESPFTENGKVHLKKTGKSFPPIYITEEYNSKLQQKKDTASGFSQSDFLENFIKERLSKMLESEKAGYYAFTVTQLESLAEKLGRPLTQMECQERCKMVLDGMYPEDETPVVKESFTTQNPTVKESLTVQKQKKEIQITKKDDIENFVRTFKASEFEVDGVVQLQSVFSENEIELITGYLLIRKEKHKSKAECSQRAIKSILNKILEIKGIHALEVVFEQCDGCYVNCGTAGDPTTPWIRLELEYFTKLIKKSTFNNQYVKPNTTPTTRQFINENKDYIDSIDPANYFQ
jgi:hypothetical protein